VGVGAAAELVEVGGEVPAAVAGGFDHRGQAGGLALERLDLAVHPIDRVHEDRASLVGVAGRAEALAVALAGRLVLEELADLGEAEPGVVAQAADVAQPLEVGLVVEAVVALGSGSGLEEPALLVIADGSGRQARLGGDLVDPKEARGVGRGHGHRATIVAEP